MGGLTPSVPSATSTPPPQNGDWTQEDKVGYLQGMLTVKEPTQEEKSLHLQKALHSLYMQCETQTADRFKAFEKAGLTGDVHNLGYHFCTAQLVDGLPNGWPGVVRRQSERQQSHSQLEEAKLVAKDPLMGEEARMQLMTSTIARL